MSTTATSIATPATIHAVRSLRLGANHAREMTIDGLVQGGIDVKNGLSTYGYTYMLGILPRLRNPRGTSCLVLGLGGGTIPVWYEREGVRADVVDIDHPRLHQRNERQQGCGGIAAGTGDQAGAPDPLAGELAQSVDGALLQIRCCVRLAVPGGIGGGIGEAEVG